MDQSQTVQKQLFINKKPLDKDLLTQRLEDIIKHKKVSTAVFKVLLVDDDDDDLLIIEELVKEVFHQKGQVEIEEAHNYQEAKEKLQAQNYDLCFVDYILGGDTGLELLQFVKQMHLKSPIVFVTGQGDEHIAVNAIKSGAEDYLIKGELNTEMIQKTINQVCHVELENKAKKIFLSKEPPSNHKLFLLIDELIKNV